MHKPIARRACGNNQPPRAGAALSGGDERGLDGVIDGRRNVDGFVHDQRIVPAHFQGQDLLRMVGKAPPHRLTDVGTPGKENPINTGMVDQRLADAPASLHQLDHARGQSCRMPMRYRSLGHARREFAWFEDDGVPREQRGNDMPVRQMPGKIKRPEYGNHAMRLEARCRPNTCQIRCRWPCAARCKPGSMRGSC